MRRYLVLVFAMALFQFAFGFYLYGKGEQDAIARYKRSSQFYFTLWGMYKFGCYDACQNPDICTLLK